MMKTFINQQKSILFILLGFYFLLSSFKGQATIVITAAVSEDTICLTGMSHIKATVTGGSGSYSYSWNSTPFGFFSTADSITIAPTVTTAYTLSIVDSVTSEAKDISITIYVRKPLSLLLNGSSPFVCAGDSVTLSAEAKGGNGIYSYNWSHGIIADDSAIVVPTSSTTYTLTVTDGCETPAVTKSFYVGVADPIIVTGASSDYHICKTDTVSLTATATGSMGNYNYSWSTIASTIVSPTLFIKHYVVTATGSCNDVDYDTVSINVHTPTVNLGNDIVQCGGPVILSLGADFNTFNWSTGEHTSSISIDSTQTIYANAIDTNGCITLNDTITITILAPTISVSFSTMGLETCSNSTGIDLTNYATPTGGQFYYNQVLLANNIFNPSTGAIGNNILAYHYVDTTNSCVATDTAQININSAPIVQFSFAGMVLCTDGSNIDLNGFVTPIGGIFTYDSAIVSNTFSPSTGTVGYNTFNYSFVDSNGCSASAVDSIRIDVCSSLTKNYATEKLITIYPNPTSGTILLTMEGVNIAENLVQVTNLRGQVVLSKKMNTISTSLDLIALSNGLYYISVQNNEDVLLKKVIVQH